MFLSVIDKVYSVIPELDLSHENKKALSPFYYKQYFW